MAGDTTHGPGPRPSSRLRLLQALHGHPASSRTELVDHSGLSRPTVTALVSELERAGIVETRAGPLERGPHVTGRPPRLISIAPRAAYAVGVDIGHDHVRAALCDLAGAVLATRSAAVAVDEAPTKTLDLICKLIAGVLCRAGVSSAEVAGVGVALAAPVNRFTGAVYVEGTRPVWGGLRPAEELEARLDLPVALDNDANLGALGEHIFGAGRGVTDLAYVRLAAGLGLGLILDGRPYRGAVGVAGELGHVRTAGGVLICRCGNRGCLQTVASSPSVAKLLARARQEHVSVRRLLELVAAGDRAACRAVAVAGEAVGEAIAIVVNVLTPSRIIIGGELAAAGAALLAPIRRAIDMHAVSAAIRGIELRTGELDDRAEILGAAALVMADAPRAIEERLQSRGRLSSDARRHRGAV